MKIRTGFVSNSSSSSFCIFGAVVEEDWFENIDKDIKEIWEEGGRYEALEKVLKGSKLGYNEGIGDYYEEFLVGMSPAELDENMTIAEHRQRIREAIGKAFGIDPADVPVAFHTDGGYEG